MKPSDERSLGSVPDVQGSQVCKLCGLRFSDGRTLGNHTRLKACTGRVNGLSRDR